MAPVIPDMIHEKGVGYTSSQLHQGRLDGRRAHANSIKLLVGRWHSFIPALTTDMATRGFHHLDCGRLLCPAPYDWGSPM